MRVQLYQRPIRSNCACSVSDRRNFSSKAIGFEKKPNLSEYNFAFIRHSIGRQEVRSSSNMALSESEEKEKRFEHSPKQSIEKRQVHFLVELFEPSFEHDVAFAFARVPYVLQIVQTLTPLVDEQRRGFRVGGLDPGREETTLVRLVPQVLVQVRVGDLLERFDVRTRGSATSTGP